MTWTRQVALEVTTEAIAAVLLFIFNFNKFKLINANIVVKFLHKIITGTDMKRFVYLHLLLL